MAYLQIKHLSKRYFVPEKNLKTFLFARKNIRFQQALDDVSFELKPGLYGLLGPNGSGKSTLMNIISGLLQADEGDVLWNDQRISGQDISFRRILGYMPQQQRLYDSFTGYKFLNYMCVLKEVQSEKIKEEIERTSEIVNLSNELNKRLASYSGGMKQRLILAAALLGTPELVILDEPTAGLDPKERVRLRENLAVLAKDKIILVATHVVPDVETVADGILFLKNGKLIDFDTPEQLIERYAPGRGLEEVYLHIFESEDGL